MEIIANYKINVNDMQDIIVYPDPNELVKNFAEHIKVLVEDTLQNSDSFHLVLSGGSTPQVLFRELKNNYLNKIDWSKIHIYWGDERCVDPESDESNYGTANKLLISYLSMPKDNIHRIIGEEIPEKEAKRYSKEIMSNAPIVNKIPQFDLIILGLGSDGHTASIFPDQLEIIGSAKVCKVAVHPKTKQKRITLTGRVINNSKNAAFLVTSSDKAPILSKILNKKSEYKEYPASYINLKNGKLTWYLDRDSSQLL